MRTNCGQRIFWPSDNKDFSLDYGKNRGFLVTSVVDFVMTLREVFHPCCLSLSSAWDTHSSCHGFSPPCWPDVWPLVMWVKKSADETHSLRNCWQAASVTAKGSSQVWCQERLGLYQQQGDVNAFKRWFGTGHKTQLSQQLSAKFSCSRWMLGAVEERLKRLLEDHNWEKNKVWSQEGETGGK